jgi:hypothetical protein
MWRWNLYRTSPLKKSFHRKAHVVLETERFIDWGCRPSRRKLAAIAVFEPSSHGAAGNGAALVRILMGHGKRQPFVLLRNRVGRAECVWAFDFS